jgi:uridine kinase
MFKSDNVSRLPGAVFFDCGDAGVAARRAREAGLLTVAVTDEPQVDNGSGAFQDIDHILGWTRFGQALAELAVDPARSVLVADSLRAIGAARGAGLWAYGVRTGYGCRDQDRCEDGKPGVPDLMFPAVAEAVDFAISYRELAAPVIANIRCRLESAQKPFLVAICGRARAGKSAVAHAALRSLSEAGIASLHVRLDDWILPAAARPQGSSAEVRNRVDALPEVLRALRAGASVRAPGYDAATRGSAEAVRYDAAGQSVVLLDGGFSAYASLRGMVDLAVFVAVPANLQQERFQEFYEWKQLNHAAIEALWRERSADEWPAVDQQRQVADLILPGRKTLK